MTTPPDPFQQPPPGEQPPPLPPGYGPPPPGYGPPPPGYGPPPPQQWGQWQQPYAVQRGTNGLAIASLVCGVMGCVYGIPAILAIVFGFIARGQIKQSGQEGSGLAIAGIVLGAIWVVIGLFVLAVFVFGGVWTTELDSSCITSDGTPC